MFTNILEYIVNADDYYRLWMVGEMQYPSTEGSYRKSANLAISQPRSHWLPELVEDFDDVRLIPSIISVSDPTHHVDSSMRFHTGNKTPTITCKKISYAWGDNDFTAGDFANRASGPARITLEGLKMWHHQDTPHRRRGDAVICETATFAWCTKSGTKKANRESGPFQVVIKNFRAEYKMGVVTNAIFDNMTESWGTEDGERIGSTRIADVAKKHGIKMNCLLADNVFEDPMDEFIFWDELARSRSNG